MSANPPEPVDHPNSYADAGYDDRQVDGMDATDAEAIVDRGPRDPAPTEPSDAERVEGDPPAR